MGSGLTYRLLPRAHSRSFLLIYCLYLSHRAWFCKCFVMLLAQDVVQICSHPLNKRCPLFSCRAHKLLIVGRHIYLCKITIGFLHVGYPMIGKFFGKTPLMCPKCPLTASPCLRRVGRYHIYSQMPHCPAK